ncbi:PIG-L deacetylase family protein [Nocardia sp. XZ_19_369]|uniref:PIG-L deacetylase family protein n=1 Tax=Nocardia sp. XZ_19_369 TaxID=2769487 RepID=UPI00188E9FFE|nr:PIG-L family deacetylase [Nocardia sp. XZ_19_369]
MKALGLAPITEIAVLGAHCDDIAIGLGGTLLTLVKSVPALMVRALVLSGAGTRRETEEHAAFAAFCGAATVELTVLDVPDGRAPAHWERVKDAVAALRRRGEADLVFAPHRDDAHQDHRLLAELVPTEFRDHLVLGYEILKWETDTVRPTVFHPLLPGIAEEKARLLLKHYPSQQDRDWFTESAFLASARVRGVQCHAEYAEAFVAEKAVVEFGGA